MFTKWLSHFKWGALVLPIISIAYFFFIKREASLLDEKMAYFEKLMKSKKDKIVREEVMNEPNFLQTYVEPIQLLKSERETLLKLKGFPYEPVRKRIAFLEENKIQFLLEEGVWKLAHPVEVGSKDLKQILSLIEGSGRVIKKISLSQNVLDMEIRDAKN